MAQRIAGNLALAEMKRLAQGHLDRLFAPQLGHGRFRTARVGNGPGALERLDPEACEGLQHPCPCFQRNRHRRPRTCGEDPVAHLGEAAGQVLRVGGEVGTQRQAQKRFCLRTAGLCCGCGGNGPGDPGKTPAPEVAGGADLEMGRQAAIPGHGLPSCAHDVHRRVHLVVELRFRVAEIV